MKVEASRTSSSTYTLKIEVPAKQVSAKIQDMFRHVAHEVVVPGFRRGKVPRRLLEAQLGKGFLDEDVQNQLMEETLPKALEQEALRPLSSPETRVVEYEEGKAFSFEVDIEVLPEIEFPDFADVKVQVEEKPEPNDEDVERVLDELQVQHATLFPKAAGEVAALGDVAVIRMAKGEAREILLSEGSDLSAQVVGHIAGESIEIKLEDQEFSLTVDELKSMEKPDLEELAAVVDKEDGAELLADIKSQLQERSDHEHLQEMRYAVLDAIIEKADVPVPPRLKEEVINHELATLERSGRVGALNEDDRVSYAEGAEQRLQREVALEALKRQNEALKLDDAAFKEIIEAEAKQRDINPVKFEALLEREGSLQRFRAQKEDERVLDYLMEQVELKQPEKKTTKTKKEKSS